MEDSSTTKQLTSGEENNLLSGEVYGSAMETESVKIIDPGVGKETVLRHFLFKSNPEMRKVKPTKLELVSAYKRLIEMSLWGDGLIIREDKPIEVHTLVSARKVSKTLHAKMKQEGADFVILVLATPRLGVSVIDKPLQAK